MIIVIRSPEACFRTLCALSELHPAQFSPLICRTWSPNRRPARDAGEFACTNWTNIPCKRKGQGGSKKKFEQLLIQTSTKFAHLPADLTKNSCARQPICCFRNGSAELGAPHSFPSYSTSLVFNFLPIKNC